MNKIPLTPWKKAFAAIEAARLAARRVLLTRRDKVSLPFGSPAASIKSNRNLLYLAAKGVIPTQQPSARVAQELTAANIAKESRREAAVFARDKGKAIQAIANEHFRKGNSSIPAKRKAKRALTYGY